jgi:uncharacterized protein YajQ (UPF0234 family)
MKIFLTCMLFVSQFAMSQQTQKVESYKYGCNGMELIANSKKGTVIVSTFNSKTQIRQEIAQKIYALFLQNKIKSNTSVTVKGDNANVIGKCVIRKKDTLTTVNFYYEKVCWYSGLTEIYRKNFI